MHFKNIPYSNKYYYSLDDLRRLDVEFCSILSFFYEFWIWA